MNSNLLSLAALLVAVAALILILMPKPATTPAGVIVAVKAEAAVNKLGADVVELREQIKKLEGLVPDQAAIMSKVAYHFTNLWAAAEQENWPLADFYLGEARSNVKWAVRSKPIRKGPDGKDVDLGGIADALDKGQFTDLKNAIDAKQKQKFMEVFDLTLSMCYSCHKASGKPYLRPQRPTASEVRIINLDPNAKTPQ